MGVWAHQCVVIYIIQHSRTWSTDPKINFGWSSTQQEQNSLKQQHKKNM